MSNPWIAKIESHVEKGVLALAVLFLGYMLWAYMLGTPNRKDFAGGPQTPGTLLPKVNETAKRLELAISNAKPDEAPIPEYSKQLAEAQTAGLFASRQGVTAINGQLRKATSFGSPIEIPGLQSEEAADSVAIVTPLRPTNIAVATGRAMVLKNQLDLTATPAPGAAPSPPAAATPADALKPEQQAWVSIAGYFDRRAQYNELTKAGYPAFRAVAYIAGVEAQRQEMQASGEWSEWKDVKPGPAMPKVALVEPAIDDRGQLLNNEEVRDGFAFVKREQIALAQPPFFEVVEGDPWQLPPLAGLTIVEDSKAEEATLASAKPTTPTLRPGSAERPAGERAGGGRGEGGGGERSGGGRGEGGGGEGGSIRPAGPSPQQLEQAAKAAARKEARQALLDANRALAKRDYAAAREFVNRLRQNAAATKAQLDDAAALTKRIEKALQLEEMLGRGGRNAAAELISHPETRATAVWFHDDSVEAGKVYRYRLRVKLWNRYVGRTRPLKDKDLARQATIAGEWSYPSEPITVAPVTHFFVKGGIESQAAASVDVWKWRNGFWLKQVFDVAIGDVIGGERQVALDFELDESGRPKRETVNFAVNQTGSAAGAVVLDVRFNESVPVRVEGAKGTFHYQDRASVTVTYLDPIDGQVKERTQVLDRNDPMRKRLEDNEL